jgi:hypothetical protein
MGYANKDAITYTNKRSVMDAPLTIPLYNRPLNKITSIADANFCPAGHCLWGSTRVFD